MARGLQYIDICLTYIGIFLSNRGPPCAQRNLAQRARETRLGDIVSVKTVLRNRSYVLKRKSFGMVKPRLSVWPTVYMLFQV